MKINNVASISIMVSIIISAILSAQCVCLCVCVANISQYVYVMSIANSCGPTVEKYVIITMCNNNEKWNNNINKWIMSIMCSQYLI
jgi:hypothetical protein